MKTPYQPSATAAGAAPLSPHGGPAASATTPRATTPPRWLIPVAPRSFRCCCGRPVFFPDLQCLGCGAPLGYDPQRARLFALRPATQPGLWLPVAGRSGRAIARAPRYRRCANAAGPAQCNWLLAASGAAAEPATTVLCRCCRLSRIVPDLAQPPNPLWWGRVEQAKRRLVALLIVLGLPVRSRLGEDPEHGLAFDLLRPQPGMAVVTGHAGGIITVNVEEADDARREALRARLGERYRTLLGHLRHESGHYYWQRLVAGSPWHEPFRGLFGDERADYSAALQRHYQQQLRTGPTGSTHDWTASHVSAYAAAHPWEDWAETWAHYLHMLDTLDSAWSFGLDARRLHLGGRPFGEEWLRQRGDRDSAAFLATVNGWIELAGVLNELARSLGHPDYYPFVLPGPAVAKLQFVHQVVMGAREAVPAAPGPAVAPRQERDLPAGKGAQAATAAAPRMSRATGNPA